MLHLEGTPLKILTRLLIARRERGNFSAVRILFIALVSLVAFPALAEDWTTTDGKTYESVKVVKVEDDAVTVLCKDGGALIPLSKLSPTLQKRFSYDPAKAKAAEDARTEAEAKNAKQLQAEIDQATRLKQQQAVKNAQQVSDGKAGASGTPPKATP
jgi:hypothetical protein